MSNEFALKNRPINEPDGIPNYPDSNLGMPQNLNSDDILSKFKSFVVKTGEKIVEKISVEKPYVKSWNILHEIYTSVVQKVYPFGSIRSEIPIHLQAILSSLIKEWNEYYNHLYRNSNYYSLKAISDSTFFLGSVLDNSLYYEIGPCTEFLIKKNSFSAFVKLAEMDPTIDTNLVMLHFFNIIIESSPYFFIFNPDFRISLLLISLNSLYKLDHFEQTNSFVDNSNPCKFNFPKTYKSLISKILNDSNSSPQSKKIFTFPPLSSVGKIWREQINSKSLEKIKLNTNLLIIKSINLTISRMKESSTLATFYFGWSQKSMSMYFQSNEFGYFSSTKLSMNTMPFIIDQERFFIWMIFYNLMGPYELGEISRESLVNLSSLYALSESRDKISNFSGDEGILTGIVENLSYLYSHIPINSPSKRSSHFRVFTPKMIGPRSLPTSIRKLYDHNFELRNKPKLQPSYSQAKSLFPSPQEFVSLSKVLNQGTNFLKNSSFLAEFSATSFKKQKTVDIFYFCWELSRRASFSSTVYSTELLKLASSEALRAPFYTLLLGNDISPELPDSRKSSFGGSSNNSRRSSVSTTSEKPKLDLNNAADISDLESYKNGIKNILMKRMFDKDYKLSLATMNLFDTILDSFDQFVYINLVLRNFCKIDASNPEYYLYSIDENIQTDNSGNAPNHKDVLGIDFNLAVVIKKHFLNSRPSFIHESFPDAVAAARSKSKPFNQSSNNPSTISTPRITPANINSSSTETKYNILNTFESNSNEQFSTELLKHSLLKSEINKNNNLIQTEDSISKTSETPANINGVEYHKLNIYNPSFINLSKEENDLYLQKSLEKIRFINNYKSSFWKPITGNNLSLLMDTNFYPGTFYIHLLKLLKAMQTRDISHNIVLTSILSKLILIGNHDLSLFMLLKNSIIYYDEQQEDLNTYNSASNDPARDSSSLAHISAQSDPTKPNNNYSGNIYFYDILVRLSSKIVAKSVYVDSFNEKLIFYHKNGISDNLFPENQNSPSLNRNGLNDLSENLKSLQQSNKPQFLETGDSNSQLTLSPNNKKLSSNIEDLTQSQQCPIKPDTDELGPLSVHSSNQVTPVNSPGSKKSRPKISQVQSPTDTITSSTTDGMPKQTTNKRLVNAYLVLDEFCNEIGSIALAHSVYDLEYAFEHLNIINDTDLTFFEKP
ncbi:hypothetical protein AYI69_g760 [Smittium culicis]|uniref:Uncharacterized protein n=1 Tax=Smittium culicis TaxID=133412 RepID=A0A1R1YS62_9FUNG|nr:hypothetical protein AYI69_g760 [Smittium culicis]